MSPFAMSPRTQEGCTDGAQDSAGINKFDGNLEQIINEYDVVDAINWNGPLGQPGAPLCDKNPMFYNMMRNAGMYARELLMLIGHGIYDRKINKKALLERKNSILRTCTDIHLVDRVFYEYNAFGLIPIRDPDAFFIGKCILRPFSEKGAQVFTYGVTDGTILLEKTKIKDLPDFEAYWSMVCIYVLYGPDPVMDSHNDGDVVLVDPASIEQDHSITCVENDVNTVTTKISELLSDPKNVDKIKSVEIAFLTASTLTCDIFWKKLLSGCLLMLDLAVDESLLGKMWSVITDQLFEGANLSTIAEMFRSLKLSNTTKSVKQFLATFLTPLVGNKAITIGEIELLSISSAEKVQGMDLASCIVDTVNYVVGAALYFNEHNSLLGFLVPVPEIRAFMEAYWATADEYDRVKKGHCDKALADMHADLSELSIRATDLRRVITDPNGSRQLAQCTGLIATKLRECYALMVEGNFKKMPFSMYIYGPTRCGKTTITKIIEKHLSDALGEPVLPGSRATISGASKFMTELRPTTKWVVIDDVASVKPEFVVDPPAETFLRLVNNVVTSLNQASVERKGEPAPQPHAVICTSNVYDMGAVSTQCDPRPILARLHMHVEMDVKNDWKDDQGLWDAKRFYSQYTNNELPDSWKFTVRQMVPEDSPVYCKEQMSDVPLEIGGVNYAMVVVDDQEFGPLRDIGIDTFLSVVRREAINNNKIQNIAEKITKTEQFSDHFCDICKNRHQTCTCEVRATATEEDDVMEMEEEIDEPQHKPIDAPCAKDLLPQEPKNTSREPRHNITRKVVSVDPANIENSMLGETIAHMREKMLIYETNKIVGKTKSVGWHFGNVIGLNIDTKLLINRVHILLDVMLKSLAKSRVLHYATWMMGELTDDVLGAIVEATHQREIDEHKYTVAIRNLLRRLGVSSCALVSPICAAPCTVAEASHEEIAQWVREKINECESSMHPSIDTSRTGEPVDLRENINTRYCIGPNNNIHSMLAMLVGVSGVALTGNMLSASSMHIANAMLHSTISCCSPSGVIISTAMLLYGITMFFRELVAEHEYAKKTIMLQIRGARQVYKTYREAAPVFSTAAAMGVGVASVWSRWSNVVRCEPASAVTRDPFYYQKWVTAHMSPVVHQPEQELVGTVKNNVVHLMYTEGTRVVRTCATAVSTSRLLVCQHFLPTSPTTMYLTRSPITFEGGLVQNSTIRIHYEPSVHEYPIGDTEVVLLWLRERVQFSDICDRFPLTAIPHSNLGSMVTRGGSGVVQVHDAKDIISIDIKPYVVHRLTRASFNAAPGVQFNGVNEYGDCGSAVLVGKKKSIIYGIFMGKVRHAEHGYAQCITKKKLDEVMKLCDNDHMPDMTVPSFEQFLTADQTISSKSNLAHLPDTNENHFDYLGKVGNFNPDRDKIVLTPITQHLVENGYPNVWSTPVPGKNPNVKSYDASMKYIKTVLEDTTAPATDVLMWARKDYFKPFIERAKISGERLRPLDWFECANGVPNSVYIHGIDTSTAMGFPYGGKKTAYMHQDDADAWWFNDDLKKDLIKADKQIRAGQIPMQAATVTNKMEPRPCEKSARKIVSVNCVMTVLTKKYFCPVFDYVLRNTDLSESAVGINPYSPEWDKLYQHMKPSFFDGVFATDSGSFDMRIASFMLMTVLLGNIDIAIAMGYTSDDIRAMHSLSNWMLATPTIIDGELIVMYNRMISGIIGTSVIDGQVLSLIQRCCFHELYPGAKDFRSAISMITFGDDNFDKVKFPFHKFNRVTLGEYCAKHGMVLTSPDKSDVETKWDSMSDVTFLKRGFKYSKEHESVVGPLDVSSIIKPLHIGVQSKSLSMDELLVEHMTRALIEMSFHGREEWEKLRSVLTSEPTGNFEKTPVRNWKYEDFVTAWKLRYCAGATGDNLSNVDNIYGSRVVSVEPASSDATVAAGEVDRVEVVDQTMQSGAPLISESRVATRAGVDFARGSENVDLGKFLERPFEIYTLSVGPAATPYRTINFWTEFLKQPSIRSKLEHYRYIRGTVKLHFFFNVSPRFYTKLMLSVNFIPPVVFSQYGYDDWATDPTNGPIDNVLASQSLCTYVSAEVSKAELIVPFVFRSEYIDMVDGTKRMGYTANGHLGGEAGILHIRSMTPLRYAGEAPGTANCDLTVSMSLHDVDLRGTTSTATVLPASSVVHKIHDISNKIVVFGTVAANVAGSIAELASLLGFSRETIGHEPGVYKERGIGSTALCDVPSIASKLTVHKDQNLYVGYDPLKENGIGDVETLAGIASRPSYLTKFTWSEDATIGQHLFSVRVTPHQFNRGAPLTDAVRFTSMGFAAWPFEYWSGTITFKFEAVASFLHRGRLLFVYDSDVSGAYSFLENRCVVLDIAGDHTVSLSVSPNGATTFLPAPEDYNEINFKSSLISIGADYACGTISVYVMNRLSAPESTIGSPVDMLVYAHMEDDAQFAVPSERVTKIAFVEPAAAVSESETKVLMNNPFKFSDDTYGMYFGEHIVSVRSLLQRYSVNLVFYPTFEPDASGVKHQIYIQMPPRGVHRGPVNTRNPNISLTGYLPNTVSGTAYNRAYTTALQYWSSAYIGMRGSTRWKFLVRANMPNSICSEQVGAWTTSYSMDAFATSDNAHDIVNNDLYFYDQAYLAQRGSQYEIRTGMVEIEVPFYSKEKYTLCRTTRDEVILPCAVYMGTGYTKQSISAISVATAVGDDFSLIGYIGPPKMYYVTNLGDR